MSRVTAPIVGMSIGFFVGAVLSILQTYSAYAAVAVRPALADVGYTQALFTGHGGDWLFYHHPMIAGSVTVVLLGGIGLFVAVGWSG